MWIDDLPLDGLPLDGKKLRRAAPALRHATRASRLSLYSMLPTRRARFSKFALLLVRIRRFMESPTSVPQPEAKAWAEAVLAAVPPLPTSSTPPTKPDPKPSARKNSKTLSESEAKKIRVEEEQKLAALRLQLAQRRKSTSTGGGAGAEARKPKALPAPRAEAERLASSQSRSFVKTGEETYSSIEPLESPMRLVLSEVKWFNGMKSLLLFLFFYIIYVSISVIRIDWWEGHQTLSWLDEAHETAHVTPMEQYASVGEISRYLEKDLGKVARELHDICRNCELGITPLSQDMQFLGLTDFVCSDFNSEEGSEHYPSRDCALEDAQWSKHPTSTSAPCCGNATLVTASMGMMTEHLKCVLAAI